LASRTKERSCAEGRCFSVISDSFAMPADRYRHARVSIIYRVGIVSTNVPGNMLELVDVHIAESSTIPAGE
jgi:hypothetical protein